jgi:predicted  nucleic acid-binding Zn-ribbon protein
MSRRRLTKEEFIEKARKIHGNFYDYSKVDYINNKTKVTIICPIHGKFEQSPNNHLKGQGCPKCGIQKNALSRTLTAKEFVEKAKEVHQNKYDYSKVDYINNHTKVEIICPIHGSFWQQPKNHLVGKGCPKCGVKSGATSRLLTAKEFIEKAKKVHGDLYDYSKITYKHNKAKVEIVCNTCGYPFQIVPYALLMGQGCPFCGYAKQCNNKPVHLYYISIDKGEYYKIGVTADTLKERFKGYNIDYKVLLWEEYKRPQDAIYKEQQILSKFDEFRYKGKKKILKRSGDTELFTKDVLGLWKPVRDLEDICKDSY